MMNRSNNILVTAQSIGFWSHGLFRFVLIVATAFLLDPLSCLADDDNDSAASQGNCPKVCLDVRQGSRHYGLFHPVSTPSSVQDFYNYHNYSFNGDDIVPLLPDQSLVLIHHDSELCDLSFVVVHDSKDDFTGGQALMFVSGNHEDALVQDGPGDGSRSDRYVYRGYRRGADDDRTELFWEWGWQKSPSKRYKTDGIADRWKNSLDGSSNDDDDDDKCLFLSARFIEGIEAWRFVPGSSKIDPKDYLYLDQDETLRVCQVECSRY
ncbi:unnamed protein product [Pseudo-nitzschia multistriata]|uniref:Uncharacterized protein n=1 Tax=Pseudo-nitzschia multistriata TaxID=183589 RepID=A0A448ZQG4_9STRA|nr:unnamed protein product [Pseudo-nitzschia multistriata]